MIACNPALDNTRVPNECSKYYRCINNELAILVCQIGYNFDPTSKLCTSPEKTPCTPSQSSSDTTKSTINESGCDSNKELTIVPDTGCTKYFKCVNGNTVELICPNGRFIFNSNHILFD